MAFELRLLKLEDAGEHWRKEYAEWVSRDAIFSVTPLHETMVALS